MKSIFSITPFNGRSKETIRGTAVRELYPLISKYADWNAEHGMYLPPDFASDPTGWANALRDMQRAFRILKEELEGEGELWEAKNRWKKYGQEDSQEICEIEAQIERGLTLFGKYLYFLTNEIYDRISPAGKK